MTMKTTIIMASRRTSRSRKARSRSASPRAPAAASPLLHLLLLCSAAVLQYHHHKEAVVSVLAFSFTAPPPPPTTTTTTTTTKAGTARGRGGLSKPTTSTSTSTTLWYIDDDNNSKDSSSSSFLDEYDRRRSEHTKMKEEKKKEQEDQLEQTPTTIEMMMDVDMLRNSVFGGANRSGKQKKKKLGGGEKNEGDVAAGGAAAAGGGGDSDSEKTKTGSSSSSSNPFEEETQFYYNDAILDVEPTIAVVEVVENIEEEESEKIDYGSNGSRVSNLSPAELMYQQYPPPSSAKLNEEPLPYYQKFWDSQSTTIKSVQGGGSLQTWNIKPRGHNSQQPNNIQVLLQQPEQQPMKAVVELWQGPQWVPLSVGLYTENGLKFPLTCLLGTPCTNQNMHSHAPTGYSVGIKNIGPLAYPFRAGVVTTASSKSSSPADADVDDVDPINKLKSVASTKTTSIDGNSGVHTYNFNSNKIKSVQILLETPDQRPLQARVEVSQGPNHILQVLEVNSENGYDYKFFAVLDLPVQDKNAPTTTMIRVVNVGSTAEFPIDAIVEPYVMVDENDQDQDNEDVMVDDAAVQSNTKYTTMGPETIMVGSRRPQYSSTTPTIKDDSSKNKSKSFRRCWSGKELPTDCEDHAQAPLSKSPQAHIRYDGTTPSTSSSSQTMKGMSTPPESFETLKGQSILSVGPSHIEELDAEDEIRSNSRKTRRYELYTAPSSRTTSATTRSSSASATTTAFVGSKQTTTTLPHDFLKPKNTHKKSASKTKLKFAFGEEHHSICSSKNDEGDCDVDLNDDDYDDDLHETPPGFFFASSH